MRINNSGHYEYCRWANNIDRNSDPGIQDMHPVEWFQNGMRSIRQSMLSGQSYSGCTHCHAMETHGKVSGRLRQLLKIGVVSEEFDKSLSSSPWVPEFKATLSQNGVTNQWPQDWQIDLGNYCNSACLFCTPHSSSRLATEFHKLALIKSVPAANWCDQPENLEKFMRALAESPKLSYLHFIGGETLITPAFEKILEMLVQQGLSSNISIGLTTNLTVWNQPVIDLLCQFKTVNLGMSIECFHPLNDYVRYGSDLDISTKLLAKWVDLARKQDWFTQLRVTPTVFSIWHLDTVYDYAYEHTLAVESCNFLERPDHMRVSVLPRDLRTTVIKKLQNWINDHMVTTTVPRVVNTRDPNTCHQQILEDIQSYINYLETQPDESYLLPDLVRYIKTMEQNRKNSILNYLPEYETVLRSAGY
jgi:sulfatase maturation enzyme AslB (radical SAM superfamily)